MLISGSTGVLLTVRQAANEWSRSQELDTPAEDIRVAARRIESKLDDFTSEVDEVIQRIEAVATVEEHTQELHFRGDLRYLKGLPPDRIKDCRIYEAILAIAQTNQTAQGAKFLVTKDSDFDYPILEQDVGSS